MSVASYGMGTFVKKIESSLGKNTFSTTLHQSGCKLRGRGKGKRGGRGGGFTQESPKHAFDV